MSKLAIDGGNKVIADGMNFEVWPPVCPEVAKKLCDLYMSHKWSFYCAEELKFAENFAKYHDAKFGTFMVNGTVTLETALRALGVGPGDEVIVPSWTWMATGMAPLYVGATPVFVDGEKDTFCMDPAAFEAAITPRTKAVIPVHLFGSIADLDKITAIAAKHGIKVIEDCAHAHGGKWNGKGVGSFGDVGSFSFQQSKIMTAGEGGLCTCNDENLYDLIGRYSHIGYGLGSKQGKPSTPPPTDLDSRNYRGTEFQAVILQEQLDRLEADSKHRQDNANYLRAELGKIPGISTQKPGRCATMQNYYVFGITVDPAMLKPGKTKADVIAAVNAEGATEIFAGWGEVTYRQRLWQVSPERYRVESFETVADIIYNRIMLADIRWINGDRSNCEKMVEVFNKVMGEYGI
ncbi:MAG: DegT/DnrJ/EryC1/StrS family aminotransferase [Lentisphaeria bacterium]|nr:DegT/DnrJ/EryC1/StrS family aminotransferase [Lentisphaeria bacterium]